MGIREEAQGRAYVFYTGYVGGELRGPLSLQRDLTELFASFGATSVQRKEEQRGLAFVLEEIYEVCGDDGNVWTKATVAVATERVIIDPVKGSVDGSVVLSRFDAKLEKLAELDRGLRTLVERYNLPENKR